MAAGGGRTLVWKDLQSDTMAVRSCGSRSMAASDWFATAASASSGLHGVVG